MQKKCSKEIAPPREIFCFTAKSFISFQYEWLKVLHFCGELEISL